MSALEARLIALLLLASCAAGLLVAGSGEMRWSLTLMLGGITVAITFLWQARKSAAWEFVTLCLWIVTGIPLLAIVAAIPYVLPISLAILLALLPIGIYRYREKRERQSRETHGRCLYCGYDLRASEARCPECGNEVEGDVYRRRRIAEDLKSKRQRELGGSDRASQGSPSEVRSPPEDPPLDIG